MPCIDNKRGLCIALTLCMDIIVFLVRAKEKVAHRRPQASGFAALFVPSRGFGARKRMLGTFYDNSLTLLLLNRHAHQIF
jgi:hypothetical protein